MIDFHTHIGRLGTDPRMTQDPADLVRKMDAAGIDMSVVLPLHDSPSGWYLGCTTEDIVRECSAFPDRLIPFMQLDPRFGDNSPNCDFHAIFAEYKARGCRGVGEVIANLHFDDPLVINFMRQCGDLDLPVVLHAAHQIGGTYGLVDDNGLPRFEKLLQECPETVFCAHGPAWWSEMGADVDEATRGGYPKEPITKPGRVAELLDTYPNLYGDLSAGSGHNALLRSAEYGYEFLERFQEQLLFATDILRYSMDQSNVGIIPYFRRLLEEGCISEQAQQKISHGNAARLLKLA